MHSPSQDQEGQHVLNMDTGLLAVHTEPTATNCHQRLAEDLLVDTGDKSDLSEPLVQIRLVSCRDRGEWRSYEKVTVHFSDSLIVATAIAISI